MSQFKNRVTAVHGRSFYVLTEQGERPLGLRSQLPETPVVGDWVEVEAERIIAVSGRRSAIVRRAPGTGHLLQVLCANIDWVFIVTGLDGDFNPRRLERYLVIAKDSGASSAFVLTKADLRTDAREYAARVERIARGCPVILSSASDGRGAEQIRGMINRDGMTGAMIGSSGAGKSTLLNLLTGSDRQAVQEVREADSRGRHTTTHRQMFPVLGGGWMIDQPGIREIQIAADEEAVKAAFADIAELATECRFRNCRHQSEPGCAVRGQLDAKRLDSYQKLTREAERAEEEMDPVARHLRKAKIKALHKAMRGHYRD